ncbi:hypothetical protein GCM10027161_37290 [Microbispora hainanensis]
MLVLMGAGVGALAAAGAAAQVVAYATGSAGSPASRCMVAEETLATSLGTLPILDARPDGMTPRVLSRRADRLAVKVAYGRDSPK